MNILLSIHHKYAKEIMNGTKRYEYRKMNFKNHVNTVFLYESFPVKRITGCFKLAKIIHLKPSTAWKRTHNFAGINKDDFFKYYSNTDQATILKVGNVKHFKKPMKLSDFDLSKAPMSFHYLKQNQAQS